jgi:nucleotide-binding universal stress UspA family protein
VPATRSPVIVVGYDGREESRTALEVAAQRAGPEGTLVVVHVTEAVSPWMGSPYYDDAVATNYLAARRTLEGLADAELDVATIEPEVIEGDPAEALIRVAQSREAREIVVGTRGLGRLRALVGSVSHRLLERADRPVIVVPTPDGLVT